jgi:hypothetical protein
MRSWLNGYAASAHDGSSGTDYSGNSFLDDAFSTQEQAAIAETSWKTHLVRQAEIRPPIKLFCCPLMK